MSEKHLDESRVREALSRGERDLGIPVSESRTEQLVRFLNELRSWSRATNLVGSLSEEDLAFHCLESALGVALLDAGGQVLDIGSGAGFPGIPLAVWGVPVTLLEPRGRRAAFLRHVLRTLPGLNAEVRADRVEGLTGPAFESATARAVGSLGTLIGEAKFLKREGQLLVWGSGHGRLEQDLLPTFRFERAMPVPGTRSREISVFRKRSTGNT